ncbi:MAG: hypothetical protein WKF85_10900 [Chitinophagaceae bacterium]
MGTNVLRIGLLITTVQFLFSASCNKDGTSCLSTQATYSFVVTSEWSPQKATYNVGDTIFLTSTFPKKLTDQINPALIIDYSNSVGVGGSYAFYELDTIQNKVKGAVLKFDFIPSIGSISDGIIVPNEQKVINFLEATNNYTFNLKVVPKAKGIFAFYVSDLKSPGLRGKNCTNAGFKNTLTNSNKNLNLFQYAIGRTPASQYEIDRIYCFRVQ